MMTPRHRYYTDVEFANLVDNLAATIHSCQFTPSEIRQAAILACIMYEERKGPTEIPKAVMEWLDGRESKE